VAKKRDLGSKLSDRPAGWQDQVTGRGASSTSTSPGPPSEKEMVKAGDYIRKTYLMTPELVKRVEELAAAEKVGINELVRHLLDSTLTQIERGEYTLAKKPVQQYTLD
jgi:hypothetical protein